MGLDVDATRAAFVAQVERRIAGASAAREDAERQVARAEARLARVRRDYTDGRLTAADWASFRDELVPELDAAGTELAQRREAEQQAVDAGDLSDAESNVLRLLADLRRRIVQDLRDAEAGEPLRAAIGRLFDGFTLHDLDASLFPPAVAHSRATFCSGATARCVTTSSRMSDPKPLQGRGSLRPRIPTSTTQSLFPCCVERQWKASSQRLGGN